MMPSNRTSRGRVKPLISQSEKEFQKNVVGFASRRRWKHYHTVNSRRSVRGFPDLCMVRGNRVVFAELKVGRNKRTRAQEEWGALLSNVGGTVEYYCWSPEDLGDVMYILR